MNVTCKNCKKVRSLSTINKQKMIEKFGSEEKLKEEYLCRKCKKELKESKD